MPIAAAGAAHYRDPGEPASALPWLIGGVCAGLLGVSVLGLILFARPRSTPPGEQVAAAGDVQDDAAQQRARDDRESQRPKKSRVTNDEDSTAGRLAPNTNPAASLTWDKEPVGASRTGELLGVKDLDGEAPPATGDDSSSTEGATTPADPPPETAPVAVNPLAALPRAVKLPRRGADDLKAPTSPVVLTRVDVDKSKSVSLKLPAAALAGGSGRYDLLPRSAGEETVEDGGPQLWDVQHTSAAGQSNIVGAYELDDGELSFAWSPRATAEEMTQLQNRPLEISAGEFAATISQRTPSEMPPLVVRVDSGAIGSTAAIESPPENADIYLAVDEFGSEFPAHQWEPANTIRVGKETDLRFGTPEDTYQLALRFTAEPAGPNKVRIEARPMFREGSTQKWDYFRPKATAQMLARLQAEESLIDTQMEQIRQRYRRNPTALQQYSAALNQKSSVLQARIANLQRISDDCQAMQDKAQVHFRLYAQDGDTQIDLVQTTKEESDAIAPKPATDPNIGAPIEPEPEAAPAPEGAPPAE